MSKKLRRLAYENIDEAIIAGIDENYFRFNQKEVFIIHPDTVHARNDLIIKRSQR